MNDIEPSENIEVDSVSTPLGTLEVTVRDGALVALKFGDGETTGEDVVGRRFPSVAVRRVDDPAGVVSALRAYFDGDVHAIDDLPVDVAGTPFQEAVWKVLRDVPAGEMCTYGDVARRIGAPRAVRAVGTAVGANPVGIVLPCHRIVPSTGGVGNYGGGVDRKVWLLAHERAET